MQQAQSFLLGWLIIRNRTTDAQPVSHLALLQLMQYVSLLSILFLLLNFYLSGWHFEYLELSHQGRTEIHENNNYKSHFVSVLSVSPFFLVSYNLFFLALYAFTNPVCGSSVLVAVGCLSNVVYLSWRNKVKKRPEAHAKLLAHYASIKKAGDDGGLSAWMELGDRHPDFVYTL